MSNSEKPLRVDVPVQLNELQIAFSIADLAFEGDLPASIFHLQLITDNIADWRAKAQVIAVFHTNAGHVTLHDEAYNAERKVMLQPTQIPTSPSSLLTKISCMLETRGGTGISHSSTIGLAAALTAQFVPPRRMSTGPRTIP
jgi:hypothetical protein